VQKTFAAQARMAKMGRFLPFSGALRQRAMMLRCMRQESAISGPSMLRICRNLNVSYATLLPTFPRIVLSCTI
jgi:hypothetical protein